MSLVIFRNQTGTKMALPIGELGPHTRAKAELTDAQVLAIRNQPEVQQAVAKGYLLIEVCIDAEYVAVSKSP